VHRPRPVEQWEPVCDRCPEHGEEADIVEIFYGVVEGPLPPRVIFGGWPISGWDPTHYCRRCGSHLLDPADATYDMFASTRPER
jgi:hypothetical protein